MLPSWLAELLNQLSPVVNLTAIIMVNSIARRVYRIERHLNIPTDPPEPPPVRASTEPGAR